MRARPPTTGHVALGGFIVIAAAAGFAWLTGEIFVFPSLGPTAFLHFHDPMRPASSPRNTLGGHAIGILCGALALWMTGLWNTPFSFYEHTSLLRVLAAALSLALTGGLMTWLNLNHPPACSTTLIISLGLMHTPEQMILLMASVIFITYLAWGFNRLVGIPYPAWAPSKS